MKKSAPFTQAGLDELSETPTTQADFDSGKLKLVKRKASVIAESTGNPPIINCS